MTDKRLIEMAEKLDQTQQAVVSAYGKVNDLSAQLSVINEKLQTVIRGLYELANAT